MRPNAEESRPRYSFQCTVCSRSCQYFYYGVKCCEACKHFFRRSISLMKEYTCNNRGNCDVSKGTKCKRCRLNMCIKVGMNARGVSGKKFGGPQMLEFVRGLKRNLVVETHKLEQSTQQSEPPPATDGGSSPTTTGPPNWADSNSPLIMNNFAGFILLKYMLEIEQKVRRIRDSQTMVPEYFYGQCNSFENILDRNLNLLECSAKFSTQMPTALPAQFLEDVQKFGPVYKRPPYLALDLLMVFEIGKTFSFFERLNSSDKIALCSNIAMPLFVLSNGFYAVQQNSDSFTTPMGFMPITLYENSYYKENAIVMKMAYKALNEATLPFVRAKLNTEEFVLVRAIIYAHMGKQFCVVF
uniref:Nuclear receptor domain-containing protein n=1 Tax=Globodera pallida TaxID=36090 RepID=A0A183CAY0_GLOPA